MAAGDFPEPGNWAMSGRLSNVSHFSIGRRARSAVAKRRPETCPPFLAVSSLNELRVNRHFGWWPPHLKHNLCHGDGERRIATHEYSCPRVSSIVERPRRSAKRRRKRFNFNAKSDSNSKSNSNSGAASPAYKFGHVTARKNQEDAELADTAQSLRDRRTRRSENKNKESPTPTRTRTTPKTPQRSSARNTAGTGEEPRKQTKEFTDAVHEAVDDLYASLSCDSECSEYSTASDVPPRSANRRRTWRGIS